jgi:hypothetical protein
LKTKPLAQDAPFAKPLLTDTNMKTTLLASAAEVLTGKINEEALSPERRSFLANQQKQLATLLKLAETVEHAHGQPLWQDNKGRGVDVIGAIKEAIRYYREDAPDE